MKSVPLALAFVCAALALTSPLSAQELERPTLVIQTQHTPPDIVPAQLRIEEALQSHRRNRLLGNGLVTAGAAAVVGSLIGWATQDRLGMGPSATGAFVGGMGLVAWGADRHLAARNALLRAERWTAALERQEGLASTGPESSTATPYQP